MTKSKSARSLAIAALLIPGAWSLAADPAPHFIFPYRLGMTGSGGGRVSALLFFVTRTNRSFLNGKYPCFGEVVAGREVVDAICRVLVDLEDRPTEEVRLLRVRVRSVGEPSPLPEPVPYTPKTPTFGPKEP